LDLAKDLVQDVFVKLWEKDVVITKEETIKSYLYVSVRNTCLNHLRQKAKEEKRILEYSNLDTEDKLHEDILEEDVHYKLYHAVNKLSSRNKESILLTIRGYSNLEIAEEMQISINSLKTLKQRSYRLLRDDLKTDFKLFQVFFI
jgi:RNA polymerase sigma-70 factor (ECF subfamily)